jgi:outer membrane protein OmpA-like peptidoglycan-associated protein
VKLSRQQAAGKSDVFQKRLGVVSKQLGNAQSKNSKYSGQISKLNVNVSNMKGELSVLQGDNSKLLSLNEGMRDKLKSGNKGPWRSIASVKDTLRKKFAKEIHQKLKKANLGLGITTDPETGDITFLMDDSFLFTNNSYELTDAVKQTLQTIVPIYSKVLFDDPLVSDSVMSVIIIGYANPTFKHVYVNPLKTNAEAYSYNLSLS